ncbi:TIR domain-containing protein [Streptomyces sp. NPDC008141]
MIERGERVFVSHAGTDRPWAEWVAWQLVDAGSRRSWTAGTGVRGKTSS